MSDKTLRKGLNFLICQWFHLLTYLRAHAIHPISAVQVEYSPFQLDVEDDKIGLLKTCRGLGIKIVAYSPLGRGMSSNSLSLGQTITHLGLLAGAIVRIVTVVFYL